MSVLLSEKKVAELIESRAVTLGITVLILINAVTLGLETDNKITAEVSNALSWIDRAILIIFSVEILVKFYAYRFRFFRSSWNIFDLLIVSIAWMPTTGALSVLRTLRILRVLRLISVVPQMRRVISAIGHSIPGMISVISVFELIFYVSAALATRLFGMYPELNMQEW